MSTNKKSPQKKASPKATPKGGAAKKPVAKKAVAKKAAAKSPTPRKKKSSSENVQELQEVLDALEDVFNKKADEVSETVAPIAEEVTVAINENIAHVQAQVKKISKWRKLFKFGKK
jgi:hypothetical protein